MRYFIAGGGCYGTYYVRQLDRARALGKVAAEEIVVIDRDPDCAVADTLSKVKGARLEVCDWLDFGAMVFKNENNWGNDMWVPTPIGPHIIYHWVLRRLGQEATAIVYAGDVPQLPYSKIIPNGALVLSHAPGLCPVNCVEPKICPLTKDDRDWEMKDTVSALKGDYLADIGVYVCHHHAHGVGTISMKNIYEETNRIAMAKGRVGVATVSSCHGILDAFTLKIE